jgi:hypothetical protein
MEPDLLPALIREHGWKIIEDIGYYELAPKYIKPTVRSLTSTPIEYRFRREVVGNFLEKPRRQVIHRSLRMTILPTPSIGSLTTFALEI